jgi:SAM-dependent methyltransferase
VRASSQLPPRVWPFIASLCTALVSIVALVFGEVQWAIVGMIATATFWFAARVWNRRTPIVFPFFLRSFLRLPRPFQSPNQLVRLLEPAKGEHILEIGPGIGTHALPTAAVIGSDGTLDVLDIQREMLDEVRRRARRRGLTNVRAQQGNAAYLPYRNATFDAAYMIGTLGEIPDGDGALRELHRVLKPTAGLVIGEIGVDPDFVSLRSLRTRAKKAGFVFRSRTGLPLAYLARFDSQPVVGFPDR